VHAAAAGSAARSTALSLCPTLSLCPGALSAGLRRAVRVGAQGLLRAREQLCTAVYRCVQLCAAVCSCVHLVVYS
jgi:hypothetical protein